MLATHLELLTFTIDISQHRPVTKRPTQGADRIPQLTQQICINNIPSTEHLIEVHTYSPQLLNSFGYLGSGPRRHSVSRKIPDLMASGIQRIAQDRPCPCAGLNAQLTSSAPDGVELREGDAHSDASIERLPVLHHAQCFPMTPRAGDRTGTVILLLSRF